MNSCTVGIELKSDCHKSTYCGHSEISEITNEDKFLLSLRTEIKVDNLKSICTHHGLQFGKYYSSYYKSCCDPLSIHSKPVKGNLSTITLDHHQLNNSLIPGRKLCFGCLRKIKKADEVEVEEKSNDTNYAPPYKCVMQVDSINPCLIEFGLSPVKRSSSMSMLQIESNMKKKIKQLNESLNTSDQEHLDISTAKCSSLDYLVTQLKEKIINEKNISQKIKLLTLVPIHWTIKETMDEFKTTQYMVRQARALRDEKGILGERSTDMNNPKKLSPEIVKQIIDFYEDDSNSRLLPGAKDYISIKTTEGRKQMQKRLILCNLSELHQKWLEESACNVKVGLTSFALLRPQQCIFAGKAGTHTICVCIHHQNPSLMIQSISKNMKIKDLMGLAVCSLENKQCMFHECENCPGREKIEEMLKGILGDSGNDIIYKQWLMTDRCSLSTITRCPEEFLEELTTSVYELTKHHYVSKSQAQFLSELKSNLKPNECIVQMDFAENFSFVIQDEVQSSYFSKQQATLHPIVIYLKSSTSSETAILQHKCYCVISDNLNHNTEAVYCYISKMVKVLKEEHPQIEKIHYFTDGAASQYKNKFNLKNLCFHEIDFGLKANWHFFGTAHGKSACDGVGGTVKRVISKISLQRPTSSQITTPEHMFLVAKESINNIKFLYISASETSQLTEEVLASRFQNVNAIKGTRSYHHFVPLSCCLQAYQTSSSDQCDIFHVMDSDCVNSKLTLLPKIYVDDWVLVEYFGDSFPGKVVEVSGDNVSVSCLEKAGNNFKYPIKPDIHWYHTNDILALLFEPELKTSRGFYSYTVKKILK